MIFTSSLHPYNLWHGMTRIFTHSSKSVYRYDGLHPMTPPIFTIIDIHIILHHMTLGMTHWGFTVQNPILYYTYYSLKYFNDLY